MVELWEEVIAHLRERVGKQNFETWIKPIQFRALTSDKISLEVPNRFFRDWLAEHYMEQISDILTLFLQRKVKVVLSVNNRLQPSFDTEKPARREERDRVKGQRSDNLIAKYTLA
jgi:chromosomal replication initiator protein